MIDYFYYLNHAPFGKKALKVCSERAYRIIFPFISMNSIELEFTMVLQPCNPLPTSAQNKNIYKGNQVKEMG
ncbi:MAG: hypothetical protein AYK18_15905 [Theionarchaea archaeon DG-70]|nr:MAG: hypothetical protein AYK18_15905 [Theionarchaea archaeon DG-70]